MLDGSASSHNGSTVPWMMKRPLPTPFLCAKPCGRTRYNNTQRQEMVLPIFTVIITFPRTRYTSSQQPTSINVSVSVDGETHPLFFTDTVQYPTFLLLQASIVDPEFAYLSSRFMRRSGVCVSFSTLVKYDNSLLRVFFLVIFIPIIIMRGSASGAFLKGNVLRWRPLDRWVII